MSECGWVGGWGVDVVAATTTVVTVSVASSLYVAGYCYPSVQHTTGRKVV